MATNELTYWGNSLFDSGDKWVLFTKLPGTSKDCACGDTQLDLSKSEFHKPIKEGNLCPNTEVMCYSATQKRPHFPFGTSLDEIDRQQTLTMDGESYYLNWSEQFNEKWLKGKELTVGGVTAKWYYILPDGDLYLWDKPSGDKDLFGPLIAVVGIEVYQDPKLLHGESLESDLPDSAVAGQEQPNKKKGKKP